MYGLDQITEQLSEPQAMVQPSVPCPVFSHFLIRCTAYHRRTVRRHRAQPVQKGGLLNVAAALVNRGPPSPAFPGAASAALY